MTTDGITQATEILEHIGVKRRSGRYPFGSGDRPYQGVSKGLARKLKKQAKGEPQKQLSKEFVRQWLIEHNFMNEPGQTMPEITDEYAESVSERYIELYEHITGETFDKAAEAGDIAARIEKNVAEWLKRN